MVVVSSSGCVQTLSCQSFCLGWFALLTSVSPRISFVAGSLQGTGIETPTKHNQYRFCMLPSYECSVDGLRAAYMSDFGFVKDGILLCLSQSFVSAVHFVIGFVDRRACRPDVLPQGGSLFAGQHAAGARMEGRCLLSLLWRRNCTGRSAAGTHFASSSCLFISRSSFLRD